MQTKSQNSHSKENGSPLKKLSADISRMVDTNDNSKQIKKNKKKKNKKKNKNRSTSESDLELVPISDDEENTSQNIWKSAPSENTSSNGVDNQHFKDFTKV